MGTARGNPCCWRDHECPFSEGPGYPAQPRTDPWPPATPSLPLTAARPQRGQRRIGRKIGFWPTSWQHWEHWQHCGYDLFPLGCWSWGGTGHNHTNHMDMLVSWEWHCLSVLAFPAFLLKPFLSVFHHSWHTDLDNFPPLISVDITFSSVFMWNNIIFHGFEISSGHSCCLATFWKQHLGNIFSHEYLKIIIFKSLPNMRFFFFLRELCCNT